MTSTDQLLTDIAREHLLIPTLETRRSDSLDFHEVAVWCVSTALKAAYEAGIKSVRQKRRLIDVHDLLAERHQVAIIWNVEDVQAVRPDLDDDQSWQVLRECDKVHDCELGFTWLLIETVADDLFPSSDEGDNQ